MSWMLPSPLRKQGPGVAAHEDAPSRFWLRGCGGIGLRLNPALFDFRQSGTMQHQSSAAPADPAPIVVTLPDGNRREFAGPVTGGEIAVAIGPGLAKTAIAVRVDGRLRDLATVIDRDAAVTIITRDTDDGLEILRHDAAHVMAEAVKELYPDTQVTFGPATETGFYYDFARAEPFTPEDLDRIEARMREIVERDERITREVWDRDAAIAFFDRLGERYKA